MKDVRSTDREAAAGELQYGSMEKSDLEALVVSAILEHRRLLIADEAVYEEWMRAHDDPTTTSSVLQLLQDEYVARQQKSGAQQHKLSDMLDALGFVPDVPCDGGGRN